MKLNFLLNKLYSTAIKMANRSVDRPTDEYEQGKIIGELFMLRDNIAAICSMISLHHLDGQYSAPDAQVVSKYEMELMKEWRKTDDAPEQHKKVAKSLADLLQEIREAYPLFGHPPIPKYKPGTGPNRSHRQGMGAAFIGSNCHEHIIKKDGLKNIIGGPIFPKVPVFEFKLPGNQNADIIDALTKFEQRIWKGFFVNAKGERVGPVYDIVDVSPAKKTAQFTGSFTTKIQVEPTKLGVLIDEVKEKIEKAEGMLPALSLKCNTSRVKKMIRKARQRINVGDIAKLEKSLLSLEEFINLAVRLTFI